MPKLNRGEVRKKEIQQYMAGYFITLEGGEGAGKSTQAKLLFERLEKEGHDVLLTREPGGTKGAEAMRELLLFGQCDFSLRSEIMAHFTARCDHVDQVIRPALQQGKIVICDRYIDSTLTYQGYGIGKENSEILQFIQNLSQLINLQPDLTFVFTLPYEIMKQRCQERNRQKAQNNLGQEQKIDHYEKLDDAFHHRVLKGFQDILQNNPRRSHRINADQPMMDIHQNLYEIICKSVKTT